MKQWHAVNSKSLFWARQLEFVMLLTIFGPIVISIQIEIDRFWEVKLQILRGSFGLSFESFDVIIQVDVINTV